MFKKALLIVLLVPLASALSALPARAQLDQTFEEIFDQILIEDFQTSPGAHANHFIPASNVSNQVLVPALNSLIAGNVSSFPLSSTVAGVTFDFSTGEPVSVTESQGPVFAEIAETLGPRRLVIGFNATHLSLDRLRGMPLEELRFTFTHEDVGELGLGDNPNELDVVSVYPNLDVEATILAFYATYGVLDNLDVGVAVPIVTVGLSGTARAVIDSRTLFVEDELGGGARHFFGGDPLSPVLESTVEYDDRAIGIGDVAVRMKYRFLGRQGFGMGALLDVRLPTGSEENFMGTGAVNARLVLIASGKIEGFRPHINAGYDYRGGDFDSDEVEVALGFDQKLADGVTFAFDVLGEFDVSRQEAIRFYDPEQGPTTTIFDRAPNTGAAAERVVHLSNVPDRDFDHTINASVGFRIAPSEHLQLLFNVIAPLQDGGLRSTVVPTVGLSIQF